MENGGDPNAPCEAGPPLLWACGHGNYETVEVRIRTVRILWGGGEIEGERRVGMKGLGMERRVEDVGEIRGKMRGNKGKSGGMRGNEGK